MNFQNKILTLTLIQGICLFAGKGWAQSVEAGTPLSIQNCIEYAKQNNSNIEVARFDERIAQEQVNEVKGRGLPQANINGSYQDQLKLPVLVLPSNLTGAAGGGTGEENGSTAIPIGNQYNSSLTGEVTQMIFDPSFYIGLKAAKSGSQLYQQQTQKVSEQTAYNIANAYYQVIVAQKQLQLLSSNLNNTQKVLANTELQFKNGVAKQVDVNRLQVNASNLKSQIQQADLSLQRALNNLKFQMGMPLNQVITLSDTALTFHEEATAAPETTDDFYKNRIDYKILQTNLELQELDRRNNVAGYYPTLSAFANYGYTAQGNDFGFFPTGSNDWFDYTTATIGLRLKIPVFDGLQRNARIQQSRLKASQLKENIKLTQQSIDLDVSNADMQYRSTLQRIESEQKNVDLAQQVYEVTQLEFQEGVGTSTDVVEAETSLRQAQNTYINTLLDLYTARLDMEKAKGTLLNYLASK